ncbi:MAG: PEP-CTERM sorting domain-containing protein [Pseudomonadota bacterium]
MITFFPALRLAALLFIAVLAAPTHASVAHAANLRVTFMYEFNPVDGQFTVLDSSYFTGSEIVLGDTFGGLFIYEDDTVPAFSNPAVGNIGSAAWYMPNGISALFNMRTGNNLEFFGNQTPNILSVQDNMEWGWDILNFTYSGQQGDDLTQTLNYSFMNIDGSFLTGSSLPPELSLSNFDYATFNIMWVRPSDGMQFGVNGDVSQLMFIRPYVEPVPEPSGIMLFLAAAACAAFVARKKTQ